MIQDHRPFWMWRAMHWGAQRYVHHFVHPYLESVGEGCAFIHPWGLEVIGPHIRLGRAVHINSAPGHVTKLCVWNAGERWGKLDIGDYVLISPGTQIISSIGISIGANTMIASNVYISDSDWHGPYDRLREAGQAKPVVIQDNAWIGYRAIIGKGVTIGRNSIIGAGAVVTRDVPDNVIAAGNPAEVKRALDPQKGFTKREALLGDLDKLERFTTASRRQQLGQNTSWGWLRAKVWPVRGD